MQLGDYRREAAGTHWGSGVEVAAAGSPLSSHSHPSPGEYVEVLGELRGVENRLQPFLQRYEEILGTAGSADYNNNVRGIELCQEASSGYLIADSHFSLLGIMKTSNMEH